MLSTLTLANEDDDNILDFWFQHEHLFPTIADISRNILAIQASGINVEHLFLLNQKKKNPPEKRTSIGL